ncbi:hypothetical protein [Marinisporobacter balticus]|uniref:Pre-peptidase n=1 Tax=Marinisporobacter balticus TaxID=2018667 RepID=A0A4R2KE68_9FIRM|nr:hypothetical protein [Marinisporobacter balticus]TCO70642.1 hypothetical protein EV214_12512 [Marinisporobacter balticus]
MLKSKKIFSLFLVVIFVFALTVSSYAATENESNDDLLNAQRIYEGNRIRGTIGTDHDVDYYVIEFEHSGEGDIYLKVPKEQDYDLYLYNENGAYIDSSKNDTGEYELILYDVRAGEKYYIGIKAPFGDYSKEEYLLVPRVFN